MTDDDYGLTLALVAHEPPGEPAPVFRRWTFDQLLAQPPKRWLVQNVIGERDLCMLFGESGAGKTFVILDLIQACVRGEMFALRFPVARPLRLAYSISEGESGLRDRFAALASWHNLTPEERARLEIIPDPVQLFDGQVAQNVIEFVGSQRQPVDLLILDTLHGHALGSEENSAKDTGLLLAACRRLRDALGCAIVLVHHTNKAGTGERGSSALRGAMDSMLEVAGNGVKVLRCAKLKDGQVWQAQRFELAPVGTSAVVSWLGGDAPGERQEGKAPILAVLTQYAGQRFTCASLAQATGKGATATANVLARCVERGEIRRALQDEERESSNRNPWLFWVDS